jgi:mercuric ion transport protein
MRTVIFGALGSAFAALCCAGIPAVVGALSAVGVGFLRNGFFLLPLLALLLGLTLWRLGRGISRHRLRGGFVVGLMRAMLIDSIDFIDEIEGIESSLRLGRGRG